MCKLKLSGFVLCLLITMQISGDRAVAQVPGGVSKDVALAQKPLKNVRLEKKAIGEFFAHLSMAYDIPLGLEIPRGGGDSGNTSYRVDLEEGTLSDLLAQFVKEHKQYTWKIDNGVVSVFPTDDYRDPLLRELLGTEISSFSVPGRKSAGEFGENLLATVEIRRILEPHGIVVDTGYLGGFHIPHLGRQFSFDVSNMQTKAILDKVIKESPFARNWIIENNTLHRKLFLRVCAASEDAVKDP